MKGRNFFVVCVLLFAAFAAGIYVGSAITQATARQQATLTQARIRIMEKEILQMREEYLKIATKVEGK
jgi:signal transduction histidine kinase